MDQSEYNIYDDERLPILKKELLPVLNRQRLTLSRGIIRTGQNMKFHNKWEVEKVVNGRHFKFENVSHDVFGPFQLMISKGDRVVKVVVKGDTQGIPSMEVFSNAEDGRMVKHDISGDHYSEGYEMIIKKLVECFRDFRDEVPKEPLPLGDL